MSDRPPRRPVRDRPPERGTFQGPCATPGCPNRSRWIPVSHVSTKPQPFLYYCASCCDRIDEEARRGPE